MWQGRGGTESAGLRDKGGVTQAITRDPDTMHGVPVFRGTRVPVQTLFDHLEGGDTLEDPAVQHWKRLKKPSNCTDAPSDR